MKKIIFVLLLLILLTGCTVVRIDTNSIDNTIGVVLSKDNNLYNQVGKGYKYYIPKGVSYIDTNDFNEKLYSKGNYYYLYVDIIGYYYQKELEYQEKDNVYYSKTINYNDKQGYLEIRAEEDFYYVDFSYNYAKIQTKVKEEELKDVVLNASYILSTIKFNHNVIELILDTDFFKNKEEVYEVFKPKVPWENVVRTDDQLVDQEQTEESINE